MFVRRSSPIYRSFFLPPSLLPVRLTTVAVRLIISRFLSFFFSVLFCFFLFFYVFSIRTTKHGDTSEGRLNPFRFPLTRRHTRGDCQSYKSAGVWLQFSINWYRAKASGPVLIPVLRDHCCVPRYQREYYIQLSLSLSPSPFLNLSSASFSRLLYASPSIEILAPLCNARASFFSVVSPDPVFRGHKLLAIAKQRATYRVNRLDNLAKLQFLFIMRRDDTFRSVSSRRFQPTCTACRTSPVQVGHDRLLHRTNLFVYQISTIFPRTV